MEAAGIAPAAHFPQVVLHDATCVGAECAWLHYVCTDAALRELVANWHVPFDASHFSDDFCEKCTQGLSEGCRDDATLRALVASWHRLTPDVRAAIMQLVRGRG